MKISNSSITQSFHPPERSEAPLASELSEFARTIILQENKAHLRNEDISEIIRTITHITPSNEPNRVNLETLDDTKGNAGVEASSSTSVDDFPLITAAKNNALDQVEALIKSGAHIHKRDRNGKTALMYAAYHGHLEVVQAFIKAGANVNAQDKDEYTALMMAACNGHLEIVQALLDHGANVNSQNFGGVTALMYAAINGHLKVVKALVKAYPWVALQDKGGRTVLEIIKSLRPKNYQQMEKLIREYHAEKSKLFTITEESLTRLTEESLIRIAVSHAWNLKGKSTIRKKDSPNAISVLDLEGANSQGWMRMISKLLQKNRKLFEEIMPFNVNRRLRYTLNFASDNDHSSEKILQRIQKGKPVFLESGWREHSVITLIWGDLFILCNRGGASRMPIETYRFDQKKLTVEHISQIQNLSEQNIENYETLIFKKLPDALSFNSDAITRILSKTCPLEREQTVGNCSFTSLITAIFAWMLVHSIKYDLNGNERSTLPDLEELRNTLNLQINVFMHLFAEIKIDLFEKMISENREGDFDTDPDMLRQVRDKYLAREELPPLTRHAQQRMEPLLYRT